MWFEILKKDLMKQKGVNIILFFFITLSTIFLAGSVSNICLVLNGLETYMEYANVSDVMVILGLEDEKEEFEEWLQSRSEVTEYGYEQICGIKADDIIAVKEGKTDSVRAKGAGLYLGYSGGKYAKPLNHDGRELTLNGGEVAVAPGFMDENALQPGDELRFRIGGRSYTYKIAAQTKDILFGNEMFGMIRFVFCKPDYDNMVSGYEGVKIGVYGFNTNRTEETLDSMSHQGFAGLMNTIERDYYPLVYVFDMIVAALLIVTGICLILISLMILRFSLSFTLEENYREIGVMKAIGMRNFAIRRIYLAKYLAVVVVGALAGFLLSIPVGSIMVESVSKNIVLGGSAGLPGINLLCSMAVIVFVAAMCVLFTGKLRKISAIEAIRNGGTGERYHRRSGLSLYKRKHMGTVAFLGLNDILCNKKRYLVLFFTFCISFVLITVPLNTLTTMESDEMVSKFSLNPDAAIYMETIEAEGDASYHNTRDVKQALSRIGRELSEKGYQAGLSIGTLFFIEFTVNAEGRIIMPLTNYPIGENGSYCEYEAGEAPRLENEVAFSRKIMEANGLQIGDTVLAKLGGKEQKLIITGYYSDYMQLGKSARLNPSINMDDESMTGYWKATVDMETGLTQEELAEKLKKEFPQYVWVTAQEAIDANVGTVKDTMRAMQLPMTMMLCILIMLIALLMMKLFIVREKGQLAMLKSIGYRDRRIREWLVMRMVWVVLLSMLFAVPLSMLCNRFVLKPLFGMMGADLRIQVDPMKAYLLYPGILLVGIIVATVFATGSVKKINANDMKITE